MKVDPHLPRKLPRAALAPSAVAAVAVLCLACAAQTPPSHSTAAAPPTFDVASIELYKDGAPAPDGFMAGVQFSIGRVSAICADLDTLIYFAYHLRGAKQVIGLPPWGSATCDVRGFSGNIFRIQATMPPETTEDQARLMMQSLLADRFRLTVHWEKKVEPVYALVIAPSGFKLKPDDPKDDGTMRPGRYGCPPEDRACHGAIGPATMPELASGLEFSVDRHIVDKTGLSGAYGFLFQWAGDNSVNSPLPSLPAALREYAGLELKSDTAPVSVLAVDSVERPSPN